jgi:hypothetical protein
MNEDEFEYWEELVLDNYLEERGFLSDSRPFDELPTLGDWLDA